MAIMKFRYGILKQRIVKQHFGRVVLHRYQKKYRYVLKQNHFSLMTINLKHFISCDNYLLKWMTFSTEEFFKCLWTSNMYCRPITNSFHWKLGSTHTILGFEFAWQLFDDCSSKQRLYNRNEFFI